MKKDSTAVVFPGQGTQRPGMGKDFYDNVDASRNTYEEASQTLGWDVAALCFGADDKINLTEYAQPCILTTEIAMYRGLQFLYGFSPGYFGGHSLGEYTALVAADAMPFAEALITVQSRGQLMQKATPPGTGGMAAVIGNDLDADVIRSILEGLPIDVANINSADQIVISGKADSLDIAQERIEQVLGCETALRFVPLNVSAPFHSRFMDTIKDTFTNILNSISAKLNCENAGSVTSNFTGYFHSGSASNLIEKLVAQLSSAVNWRENMAVLAEKAQSIYEIGPNRPLKNFFKTIDVDYHAITTFSAAQRAFA
jgi:[acyl-carrier-protein] S-malonyltransferase/trans-AT polyketide synthase/acyltransferase/oxidoreductase domain-containing protein